MQRSNLLYPESQKTLHQETLYTVDSISACVLPSARNKLTLPSVITPCPSPSPKPVVCLLVLSTPPPCFSLLVLPKYTTD